MQALQRVASSDTTIQERKYFRIDVDGNDVPPSPYEPVDWEDCCYITEDGTFVYSNGDSIDDYGELAMNDETPIYLDKHHCAVTEFGAPLSDAGEEGYRVNKYGDNIDDEEEDIDAVYEDSEEEDEDDDAEEEEDEDDDAEEEEDEDETV